MDERQQQVKVGAGLEESRINQELIDWLNKWGFRILIVILLIVAGYQGKRWYDQNKINGINQAFVAFHEASIINDPGGLIKVGREYEDIGSLWELSHLRAARILLVEGTRGIKFSTLNANAPTPDEVLDEAAKQEQLTRARDLFAQVAERAAGTPSKKLMELQAMLGQATATLSLGDRDAARTLFETVKAESEGAGFADIAAFVTERLEGWDGLENVPTIVAQADLPASLSPLDPLNRQPGALNFDFQEEAGGVIRSPLAPADESELSNGPLLPDEPAKTDPSLQPNVPVRTVPADPEDEPATDDPIEDPADGG